MVPRLAGILGPQDRQGGHLTLATYQKMKLTVSGKQVDVGNALQDHVAKELPAEVDKYFANAVEAQIVFSRQGQGFRSDISIHVGRGILVQAHGDGADAYQAFARAIERATKRLRRYKRRLRDHHGKAARREEDRIQARQVIFSGAEDEPDEPENGEPAVVAEMTTDIDSLTVSEAVMRMDLADQPAMMFRNISHGGLNMIYRRADGNIGWVDPRGGRERTQ